MDPRFCQVLREAAAGLRQRARRFPRRDPGTGPLLPTRGDLLSWADGLTWLASLDYPTREELDLHSWQKDDHPHAMPVPG